MAEISGQQTPPAADKPKVIPSFSGVVKDRQEERSQEIADLAGAPPKGTESVSKTDTPPAKTDTLDVEAEWAKLPENLRQGLASRFYDSYNSSIQEQYGDILPLVAECNKNPNLRATLAAAATDPELREYLADPKARDEIKRLNKKELREFLFNDALRTYESYEHMVPKAQADPARDPGAERIKQLEDKFQADLDMRDRVSHVGARQREIQALTSEFPGLKEDQKLLQHVVGWAEQRFEQQAMRAGIVADDTRNPGWPAQALRAGIKPPTYREGYEYYAEVLGRSAPPAAPQTSAATPPQKPQAPRTATEGRSRENGLQYLKKKGGFNNLVAAASRRGKD